MRINLFILAVTTLIIATFCASIALASKDTSAATPENTADADVKQEKSKEVSLKDKLEAIDRVMFLAKRKFSIEDSEYNILLNDAIELITKEHELEEKSVSEEEKAAILIPMREKLVEYQKKFLQDKFEEYVTYLKENEYYKLTGWANVEKGNGLEISLLGIIYVFSGLVILVILLFFFGKIFAQKAPQTDVITIEMDDSPVRESSQSQVKRKVSTILIRKDKISQRAKAVDASGSAEDSKDQKMKEIAVAIAMAIHAELHLYPKSEKITVLDYPNVVSSWAFSTRPMVNSHFQQLRKK